MTKGIICEYNNEIKENEDNRLGGSGYKMMGANMTKKSMLSENVKLGYKEKNNNPKHKAVSDNFITFNGTLLTTEKNPDAALYIKSETLSVIDSQINKCNEDFNEELNDGSEFEYLYENK